MTAKLDQSDKLDLQSMYLNQPVMLAHGVRLVLGEETSGTRKGQLHIDPNRCMLNGWGDRAGCTKMAIRTVDVAATRMRTLDPAGLRRNLYKVHSDVFEREEVHLIEYPDAHLWYLVCAQKDAGTSVVPLFPSELFAPNSGGVIVTRYGVAMREVIARGDVDEMRAEAERVREALADFDGPRKRMAGVRVDDDNVREVREALDELQKALAEIED